MARLRCFGWIKWCTSWCEHWNGAHQVCRLLFLFSSSRCVSFNNLQELFDPEGLIAFRESESVQVGASWYGTGWCYGRCFWYGCWDGRRSGWWYGLRWCGRWLVASGKWSSVGGDLPPGASSGTRFAETPMTVPCRGHLDEIRRLMAGDVNIGQGCRQRGLRPSPFRNLFKVSEFGRETAINFVRTTPGHLLKTAP